MTLAFPVPNGEGSLHLDLGDPGGGSTLGFMPVTTTEQAGIHLAGAGSLEVSEISFGGGEGRIEGRFEGSFRTPRPSRSCATATSGWPRTGPAVSAPLHAGAVDRPVRGMGPAGPRGRVPGSRETKPSEKPVRA